MNRPSSNPIVTVDLFCGAAGWCDKHNTPKVVSGRKKRVPKCRACNRERVNAVRARPVTTPRVSLAGARERLAIYLDTHWDEAVPRLAKLLEGWGPALSGNH